MFNRCIVNRPSKMAIVLRWIDLGVMTWDADEIDVLAKQQNAVRQSVQRI